MRRILRRAGIALVELLVFRTVASLIYNAATAGRQAKATTLYPGPFVRVARQ